MNMGPIKPVTSAQTDSVRDMANAKGVGREAFQKALDNGDFGRFLDGIKTETIGITPPQGARIHTLRLTVQMNRPWQEAIDAAGPDTPADYNVRKVGDLYPATGTDAVEGDYIILNFPAGNGNWDKALAWAQGAGLKNTVPREVFAVGEHNSSLHRTLGVDPMYVVATTDCSFVSGRNACYVWWHGSERKAYLNWISNFDNSNDWFLFRK